MTLPTGLMYQDLEGENPQACTPNRQIEKQGSHANTKLFLGLPHEVYSKGTRKKTDQESPSIQTGEALLKCKSNRMFSKF
jgi:hypothetical protein